MMGIDSLGFLHEPLEGRNFSYGCLKKVLLVFKPLRRIYSAFFTTVAPCNNNTQYVIIYKFNKYDKCFILNAMRTFSANRKIKSERSHNIKFARK